MTKGTRGASTSVLGRTFIPQEYIHKYFNTSFFPKKPYFCKTGHNVKLQPFTETKISMSFDIQFDNHNLSDSLTRTSRLKALSGTLDIGSIC